MMILQQEELIPATVVHRKSPINITPQDDYLFQHEYTKSFDPVNLISLKNVNVTTEGVVFRGVTLCKKNILRHELNTFYQKTRYLLSKYLKGKRIILKKDETYVLVFDSWSHGYFHWMCDVLPRLLSAKKHVANSYLLIPESYHSPFITETLAAIPCKGIQTIPSSHYVFTKNLILPEPICATGNYNVQLMHEVKNRLTTFFNIRMPHTGCKNIYVSRKKAAYRKILNEAELLPILKKYNFEIIYFENHTLKNQIAIMSEAKIMIGLHGANLTNLLFMPAEGYLFELRSKNDAHNNAYFSLASAMNLHYLYQCCNSHSLNYQNTTANKFDIVVDAEKFESILVTLLTN
jgi:capsular polysaccharide biosynthesis protein